MTYKRIDDNPQLTKLAGTEVILAQSIDGGTDTSSNPVAPKNDIKIPVKQLLGPKITSTISSGSITPDANTDLVRPAALTAALTIANPSSTPVDGWSMVLELKDNGTARALTWGSKYTSRIAKLPTTTVAGKQHVIVVSYNAADDKLYCDMAAVQP